MPRFALVSTLATAAAVVVGLSNAADVMMFTDEAAFLSFTEDLGIMTEDFEDENLVLTYTSNSVGNNQKFPIAPGKANTGLIRLPYGEAPWDPESSFFFPDGAGVFLDKFFNRDPGATVFLLPQGTSAWGATFDLKFESQGIGLQIDITADNDEREVLFSNHYDGDFVGFIGMVSFDADFSMVNITQPFWKDQSETYLIDNMHFGGSRSSNGEGPVENE